MTLRKTPKDRTVDVNPGKCTISCLGGEAETVVSLPILEVVVEKKARGVGVVVVSLVMVGLRVRIARRENIEGLRG